jgi:hypothetical protein
MIRSRTRLAVVVTVVAAAATVLGTTTMAFGSVKPGTTVTGKSTNTVFTGSINGVPITVKCKSFTDKVKVTSSDKTSASIPPPTLTGCTDTLKGTDTIKTTGKWELKVNSAGTTLTLVIPKDGATFSSSRLKSCKITVAPTGPVNVNGSYSSSTGTDTVTNQTIAIKGSGCSATSSTINSTVKFTPNPGKIPPFAS